MKLVKLDGVSSFRNQTKQFYLKFGKKPLVEIY